MRSIAVLGSTGSIGTQTLEVVSRFAQEFRVVALTAAGNYQLLAEQARRFRPEMAVIADSSKAAPLAKLLAGTGVEVLAGEEGMLAAAGHPGVEYLVVSVVGFAGLKPTIAALRAGKQVLLANKETLVVGGELVATEIAAGAKPLWPIDSEHSALWQCLRAGGKGEVRRLVLTASGGPFLGWDEERLKEVTPERALRHPNWNMGAKVTIDSATLMNKGLEVLEARWLFDIPLNRIDVIVQPESVVHSMVEFVDGSFIAQMGIADMRLPIQHALTYPERWPVPEEERLNWDDFPGLIFLPPDRSNFPCLDLAYAAGKEGGTMPAVMSAADEVAVKAFLERKLEFLQIAHIIETVMNRHKRVSAPRLEQLVAADRWAREEAKGLIKE